MDPCSPSRYPTKRICVAAAALFFLCPSLVLLRARTTPVRVITEPRPARIPGIRLGEEVFDLRFAPARWQAAICYPDDPHKSIVGSDGALYYDYDGRGPFYGFQCRVGAAGEGEDALVPEAQRLLDPRIPVVITRYRAGSLVLEARAWAMAPDPGSDPRWPEGRYDCLWLCLRNPEKAPAEGRIRVRVETASPLDWDAATGCLVRADGSGKKFARAWPRPEKVVLPPKGRLEPVSEAAVLHNWAKPDRSCDPRFTDILVGWHGPLRFRFRAGRGENCRAAFALVEGYHTKAGVRPLELRAEGGAKKVVDPVGEHGANRLFVVFLDGRDADGDGFVELGVYPAEGAEDDNTILSGLWVFPKGSVPSREEILSGRADARALAHADTRTAGKVRPVVLAFPRTRLAPGEKSLALLAVYRGARAAPRATRAEDGGAALDAATAFWRAADLPFDRIRLPDRKLQGLLDACIRNIYQARELRNGRPAFQVGPTCYRSLWAADGPFILEAVTYLGRADETRPGLELLAEGDEGPQGVAFSKKSGLRLWMIFRHFQLTGDRAWLEKMWPKVEAEVARIKKYRAMTRNDPGRANFGLMPPGFGDGGLGGIHREYTNVYWNLSGLEAACQAAETLGRAAELRDWRAEYRDFWDTFDRARNRDKRTDAHGNVYVPVVMKGEEPQPPQRGAWAFLQSVFPGRIFAMDDALMLGTMAMLTANEREGLIYGTGWMADGIWNYAGSFYGHAHLWLGHGRKAASILYAFANHACPLLCWREEQSLRGEAERYWGDMPHNWASAEFIRLVRHLLVLERGRELHLLEGLPRAWTRPGMETVLQGVPTSFGAITLRLAMDADGGGATMAVTPPAREPPERIVVHLENFGRPKEETTVSRKALPPGPGGREREQVILRVRFTE